VRGDVEAAAAAAAERGAPVLWVSERGDRDGAAAAAQLPVPAAPEPAAALLHAVRAQQLALHASRLLGVDPDAPRGLRKVTPTT
jgi:glucosamine--fructose-6-phosphate aminotransferase (isomerizing)